MRGDVGEERQQADRGAVYASRKTIGRLAPLVERLADRLDRPSSRDAVPILLRAPDRAPLRPDTRKVLVFDASARAPVWTALGVLFFVGPFVVIALHQLVTRGDPSALAVFLVTFILMSAGLLGCALAVAGRLRALRALLARCVVVPSRVTDARVSWHRLSPYSMIMTIQYLHGEQLYQTSMGYGWPEAEIIGLTPVGSTPDLLVDPQDPHRFFLRELYV